MKELNQLKVLLYGTGPMAESLLITLVEGGVIPKLLVTKPDSKVGRAQTLQSPNIKHLAKLYNIPVVQPKTLKFEVTKELADGDFDIGIVASYGLILPENILEIPTLGTINVHPSLLPLYRGPTPIETALLNDEDNLCISIMFLDDKVDHGPILLQNSYPDFIELPDASVEVFEKLAGIRGGIMLLTEVLLPFCSGAISVEQQDHSKATYTKKYTKETGLVTLSDSIEKIHSVFRACTPWPGCYFMHKHNDKVLRIKITDMQTTSGTSVINKVIPEGKKEMDFESFKRGYIIQTPTNHSED